MSELGKKKKEEYTFEIEMGANIKLEEEIPSLSLLGSCPRCGLPMDSDRCNYCGYLEFKKLDSYMF